MADQIENARITDMRGAVDNLQTLTNELLSELDGNNSYITAAIRRELSGIELVVNDVNSLKQASRESSRLMIEIAERIGTELRGPQENYQENTVQTRRKAFEDAIPQIRSIIQEYTHVGADKKYGLKKDTWINRTCVGLAKAFGLSTENVWNTITLPFRTRLAVIGDEIPDSDLIALGAALERARS
jgi:hypothetical protein